MKNFSKHLPLLQLQQRQLWLTPIGTAMKCLTLIVGCIHTTRRRARESWAHLRRLRISVDDRYGQSLFGW